MGVVGVAAQDRRAIPVQLLVVAPVDGGEGAAISLRCAQRQPIVGEWLRRGGIVGGDVLRARFAHGGASLAWVGIRSRVGSIARSFNGSPGGKSGGNSEAVVCPAGALAPRASYLEQPGELVSADARDPQDDMSAIRALLGGECLKLGGLLPALAGGTVFSMTKTEPHELVDASPDESLSAAAILLRRAQDPAAPKLDAVPYDDEELTEEDLRAVQEARSDPGISWSDAEAELNAG